MKPRLQSLIAIVFNGILKGTRKDGTNNTGGIMLIALPGLLGERKNIMALTGVGN